MRFDLTDLRLFRHVADSGSITAGARLAHLALPSASERVRGMEAQLGVVLLKRSRRGVEVTDAGRALLHHARLIGRQVEAMQADLAQFADGIASRLRLLCNTSAMTEFLPDALAGFVAARPKLAIDLEERLSRDIVQALVDELADIGIITDFVDHAALQTFPFRDDPLVLAMAPGHPLARRLKGRRTIAFADTLDHDFIGLAGDSALQMHITEQATRLGRHLRCRARLRSFEAVCRLVASGAGLAIVPAAAARRGREPAQLRLVRLSDPWAARKLLICVRDYASLAADARDLVDTLMASSRG